MDIFIDLDTIGPTRDYLDPRELIIYELENTIDMFYFLKLIEEEIEYTLTIIIVNGENSSSMKSPEKMYGTQNSLNWAMFYYSREEHHTFFWEMSSYLLDEVRW